MGFDAFLNTICLTGLVLLGLWIVVYVVQAVELLFMMHAYKNHQSNVFAIPFVPLTTRLFHDIAVPHFLASEAIQRGELPSAVTSVKRSGAGGSSSLLTSTSARSVTNTPSPPPASSTSDTLLRKLSAGCLAGIVSRKKCQSREEPDRRSGGDIHEQGTRRPRGSQEQNSVAVVFESTTRAAADTSEGISSHNPAWWTPELEGQCLVLGLHLPLELLSVPSSSPQTTVLRKSAAPREGSSNANISESLSGTRLAARRPTVNLQVKHYQLTPSSLDTSAAALSPALSRHIVLPSSAGPTTRVAAAQQFSVLPRRAHTPTAQPSAWISTFAVPSTLTFHSSPTVSTPTSHAWPGVALHSRAQPQHPNFDAVRNTYTNYYRRLLEVAVAEETAMAQRGQSGRKSVKYSQKITAMLMHYLEYAYAGDLESGVRDTAFIGDRSGGGSGANRGFPTSSSHRIEAVSRDSDGNSSNTIHCVQHTKHGSNSQDVKDQGDVGVSIVKRNVGKQTPWIPVLQNHTCEDQPQAARQRRKASSSALLGRSHHRERSPLSPAHSEGGLSYMSRGNPASHLTQPTGVTVNAPPLSLLYGSRRSADKRRRYSAGTPDISKDSVARLEGLVERLRLAQALRPVYRSFLCSTHFTAERFVVRCGSNEPPAWVPARISGHGEETPKFDRSFSSTSQLSPHKRYLYDSNRYPSFSSATEMWSSLTAREMQASGLGGHNSLGKGDHRESPYHHTGIVNRDIFDAASFASRRSATFTGGQLTAEPRYTSLLGLQTLSVAAGQRESEVESGKLCSSGIIGGEPPPLTSILPQLDARVSISAPESPSHPGFTATLPVDAPADLVGQSAIQSPSTNSHGTSSSLNAAMEFLLASRLPENHKKVYMTAGIGNSHPDACTMRPTMYPKTTTSVNYSHRDPGTVEDAEVQSPGESTLPQQGATRAHFPTKPLEGVEPLQGGGIANDERISEGESGDASGKGTQRVVAGVHALVQEVTRREETPPVSLTSSRRFNQHEQHPMFKSRKDILQSGAPAQLPLPRNTAIASPPWLQPRSRDLRVVYAIGADRATLLRSLTLDATHSFGAGRQNFLCFFTPRDERRTRRRYMKELDRQNRIALHSLTRAKEVGDAVMGNDHSTSVEPRVRQGTGKSPTPHVTAALRSPTEPPRHKVQLFNGIANVGEPVAAGSLFHEPSTVGQRPHPSSSSSPTVTTRFSPAASPLDTPVTNFFTSLTHQYHNPPLSEKSLAAAAATANASNLAPLEASFHSAQECSQTLHEETPDAPLADAPLSNRSCSTSALVTMQSSSTMTSTASHAPTKKPLISQSYGQAPSPVKLRTTTTTTILPNTGTVSLVEDGNVAGAWQTLSLPAQHGGKGSTTANTFNDSLLSFTSLGDVSDDEADTNHTVPQRSLQHRSSEEPQLHHGEMGPAQVPASCCEATADTPGFKTILQPVDITGSSIALTSEANTRVSKVARGVPIAATVHNAAALEQAKATASQSTATDNPALLSMRCDPAHGIVTDTLSAHSVQQYYAAVGVTMPEQVYALRDAQAWTLRQQLQHDAASATMTTAPQDASVLSPRKGTVTRLSGADAKTAVGLPHAVDIPVHPNTLPASITEVLFPGTTRILEGQVEVAELTLDVLSRLVAPFVPQKPPPVSDNDSSNATSTLTSISCNTISEEDQTIGVREDGRDSSSPRQREEQPQNCNVRAAASRQRGHASKPNPRIRRTDSSLLPHNTPSRRPDPQYARSSGHQGERRSRASHEHRQHRRVQSRKSRLSWWRRRLRSQRAAARKADHIPIACGMLFFTAPPILPTALVRQQLLQKLHDDRQEELLVPDWALDGLEAVKSVPASSDGAPQDERTASPSHPLGPQLPMPNICVTLIYIATAEEVAHALVQAAELTTAASAKPSDTYGSLNPWLREGSLDLAVATATTGNRQDFWDGHEQRRSFGNHRVHTPTVSPRWLATPNRGRGMVDHRHRLSPVSTAPPSKESSFFNLFNPTQVMSPMSQFAFSMTSSDVFLEDERPLHHCDVGSMSLPNRHPITSSSNHGNGTQNPSEEKFNSVGDGDQDSDGDNNETRAHSNFGAPAAAASAPKDTHGKPPFVLVLTESHVGGVGATVPESKWDALTFGSAGSDAYEPVRGEGAEDDMRLARVEKSATSNTGANNSSLSSANLETAEAWGGGGGKGEVSEKLMKVLSDSACFPEGVPVDVSLAYVRIGNDLYAITEVVDRTFLQYREERAIKSHPLLAKGGASTEKKDDDSSVFLSDIDATPQGDSLVSSPAVGNSSVVRSHETTNFVSNARVQQHETEVQQQQEQQQHRHHRHRRAVSTSDFGGLSYSLADSTPVSPGVRRQVVYMCWRCLSAEAMVIFVPCGHYAVCETCAELLADCCLCHTPIESSVVLLKRAVSEYR